jgi:hypothetical protein
VTLVPLLAGCDPLVSGDDPIAARLEGGVFTVAVCRSWNLTSVLVETRSAEPGSDWVSAWVGNGQTSLVTGDVLTSDSPPPGFSASAWNIPALDSNDELTITLVGEDQETLDAIIRVPESGFPDAGWLQPDGTITHEAC